MKRDPELPILYVMEVPVFARSCYLALSLILELKIFKLLDHLHGAVPAYFFSEPEFPSFYRLLCILKSVFSTSTI